MKPGYSLIEISIGILLSSMLAISLFQSVGSTTKTVQLADELMDLDMRTAIFHHQFQKDTAGIFVPEKPEPPKPPANEKGHQKQEQKKPAKPITFPDKLFYSVNKGEQLDQFTFITSNPVQVYAKAANVSVKPRMVRVVYHLEADPAHKGSYNLYRQESENLNLKAFNAKDGKKIRQYELLGNVKKLSLDFSYPVKKEDSKAGAPKAADSKAAGSKAAGSKAADSKAVGQQPEKQKQSADIEIEKIVKRIDWPFATVKDAKEQKAPPCPDTIAVQLEIWDNSYQEAHSITLTYPIASFSLWPRQKRKRKKAAQPKKRKSSALKPETEKKLARIGEQMMAMLSKTKKVSA